MGHAQRGAVEYALARMTVSALPCDHHGKPSTEAFDEAIDGLDRRMVVADQDAVAECGMQPR
jgi:hypothetical protein